jgi:hypothetical protein
VLCLYSTIKIYSEDKKTERTFSLNKVKIADKLLSEKSLQDIIKEKFGEPEASSSNSKKLLFSANHPFVEAIHNSFASHRPIIITPDHIWLLIAQGFAAHVNNNSEKLRDKFVKHKEKLVIKVRRDDFIKGNKDNPWEEVFPEFCKQIGKHIGKNNEKLLTAKFSTTSIIEQAAFEITLMDSMSNYFSYLFVTLCGIPSITLEGTTEDWKALRERAEKLKKYDLKWWIDEIDPILKEFVNASAGNVNLKFWNSIYKEDGESGGPYITGWILKFFPYLSGKDGKTNRLNPIFKKEAGKNKSIGIGSIPNGMSKAPFVWLYYNKKFKMEFLAGFIAISQDHKTKSLKPYIGWIIREQGRRSKMVEKYFPNK